MIVSRTYKWNRVDWLLLVGALGLSVYAVWLIMDDGSGYRQMAYLRTLARLSQRAALHFGEIGLAAEIEYHRLIELEHIC